MSNSENVDYLIYKKYIEGNIENENAKFRRQLFDKLNCGADYNYTKFYNSHLNQYISFIMLVFHPAMFCSARNKIRCR